MHIVSLAKSPQSKPQTTKHIEAQPILKQSGLVADLLTLQQSAGNHAVNQLLRQQGGTLQAELKVNQPGDVYEQEADQVAEQVMRMGDPQTPILDEENEARTFLMRKQSREPGTDGTTGPLGVPPVVHAVLNSGGGQPLDTATRALIALMDTLRMGFLI